MNLTLEPDAAPANDSTDPLAAQPIVALPRRTVDKLLIAVGILAAVVLAAAGGLLTWGSTFANDYVYDELSSQEIFFPSEEALVGQDRNDLVRYADEQVTTGKQAEAYASYIDGHLGDTTYAGLGAVERAARAAVAEAEEAGATDAEIADLQAEADAVTAQRDTQFKGETLRGLLLSTYAWSTIGQIAFIASIVAYAGAALMAIAVLAGSVHLRRSRTG